MFLLVMSYARYVSLSIRCIHKFYEAFFSNSPHWLVSWHDTYSPFKNMGLWEFCFNRFRYPNYQFDKLFDGCHYIFSQEYYVIWEWLLPGISIALIDP